MYALRFNDNLDIIKFLVEDCGCNMEYCDDNGKTALIYAVKNENPSIDIIKYLIEDLDENPD